MGQNYSDSGYKKTYEGDYQKSFDLSRVRNPRIEYEGLEKTSSDSVHSEGPRRTKMQRPAPLYPPKVEQKKESALPPVRSQVKTTSPNQAPKESNRTEQRVEQTKPIKPQTQTPPPPIYKAEAKTVPRETRPVVQTPPSVFNPFESLDHPIKLIGVDMYEEVKTRKKLNEDEAREILINNGYEPKTPVTLFILLAIAIVTMAFNPIMPIILAIMSWFAKNRQYTNFQKNVGEHVLKYQMPATEDEMEEYAKRANIFMVIGIVLSVISISILSNG